MNQIDRTKVSSPLPWPPKRLVMDNGRCNPRCPHLSATTYPDRVPLCAPDNEILATDYRAGLEGPIATCNL